MKGRGGLVLATVTLVAAALASTAGAGSSTVARTQAIKCSSTMKLAVLTPYTGPASFLGADQGSWANLAAKNIGAKLGLKFKIVAADSTLDPAVAATAAQKVIADSQVVGVVGPATSGAAAGTSQAFFDAKLAAITGSATNSALTKSVGGKPKTATAAFFRVVADDSVQGTRDALYMVTKLGAKKVAVFDAQEPYSQGLADTVEAVLKAKGVAVQRFSVTNSTTDYSAIVNRIDKDTDVAFTPFQIASNAQAVAVTLRESGRKAIVFGTDGTISPEFKFPGSYVSNFGPDLTLIPSKKALVDQWKKANPGKTFSAFGPPAYGAAQVIMEATKKACVDKKGTITRQDVLRRIKTVKIKDWILGGSFAWSKKTNDPLNGSFWLFQIQSDGTAKQLGKIG
jgi:branched-chain amino acid transport system substrate-binding protein